MKYKIVIRREKVDLVVISERIQSLHVAVQRKTALKIC